MGDMFEQLCDVVPNRTGDARAFGKSQEIGATRNSALRQLIEVCNGYSKGHTIISIQRKGYETPRAGKTMLVLQIAPDCLRI